MIFACKSDLWLPEDLSQVNLRQSILISDRNSEK